MVRGTRHLRPEQQEAIRWLQAYLLDGPARSLDLYRDAAAVGLTDKRLRRIRQRAGVSIHRVSTHPDGSGHWAWSLRPDEHTRILRRTTTTWAA